MRPGVRWGEKGKVRKGEEVWMEEDTEHEKRRFVGNADLITRSKQRGSRKGKPAARTEGRGSEEKAADR